MDYVYTFGDPTTLYLNVTNRCTNSCAFCVRNFTTSLGNGQLRAKPGEPEPNLEALMDAIETEGDLEDFEELVWCGFGEPTFRLDLIEEAGPILKAAGPRIRLNTNGHGSAIHGLNILPVLGRSIDVVSVSLNAPTRERYVELCDPDPTSCAAVQEPEELWDAMVDFLRRAPAFISEVQASVVAHVLDESELRACRDLVEELGSIELRLR